MFTPKRKGRCNSMKRPIMKVMVHFFKGGKSEIGSDQGCLPQVVFGQVHKLHHLQTLEIQYAARTVATFDQRQGRRLEILKDHGHEKLSD